MKQKVSIFYKILTSNNIRAKWLLYTFVIVASLTSFKSDNAVKFKKLKWKKIEKKMPAFADVFDQPEKYKLKIIYTQINRDTQGKVYLKDYPWKGNTQSYFYPASTIKLPTSLFALEKIAAISGATVESLIEFDTSLICNKYRHQSVRYNYHTLDNGESISNLASEFGVSKEQILGLNVFANPDNLYTGTKIALHSQKIQKQAFADKLSQMLLYSDNDLYNQLYDFVGQEYMHTRLQDLGYKNSRILRRLLYCDTTANKHTLGYKVYNGDSVIYVDTGSISPLNLSNPLDDCMIGVSHWASGKFIDEPKDFCFNNNLPLQDIHNILKRLVFPNIFPDSMQFKITPQQRHFILTQMALYPREVDYQNDTYATFRPDGFTKYLMTGNSMDTIPSHIRIFNIVGQAYGFMTDCAYIIDYKNNIDFFLSASIYVNNNNVLGDDKYQYGQIGMPFFEELGKNIHAFEIKRRKKNINQSNSSEFLEIN